CSMPAKGSQWRRGSAASRWEQPSVESHSIAHEATFRLKTWASLWLTGNPFQSCAWKNGLETRPFVPIASTTVPFPESARRFTLFLSSTRGRAVQRASQDSNQSLGRFVL